ncbi:hypothetical protein CCM_03461 [Cordyceps militaris CM01]|uniref:Integral membrane protein n=1 Tax=Cordyceps militaris (strain CM01) TaxID=983644 RepID=G3JAX7_CORMM|nr:uncharacterized protein CCM_03461 [Cordyceps militaris CM01]EGX95189.1 hypothetical protein CCM_03461 [Cordyceps militaris CM01]
MEVDLPSLFFGATVGIFPFVLSKIISQTWKIMGCLKSVHSFYVYMIWLDAFAGLIFGIITILYLKGVIPGHFGFFFASVLLWAIQTQFQPQIIANRLSIIMTNRRKANWLRIGLFLAILPLNIMVYFIWISAHLPNATEERKRLNQACERMEKSVFLVLDLVLNLMFLHLVRSRLISGGLTKYWRLFNMNVFLIGISTTLDAALLGMISLPDPYVYVQFTPLVYIIKLYIELVMANLIAKIARSDNPLYGGRNNNNSSHMRSQQQHNTTTASRAYAEHSSVDAIITVEAQGSSGGAKSSTWNSESDGRSEVAGDEYYLVDMPPSRALNAIMKTVEITVSENNPGAADAERRKSQQPARLDPGGIPGNWATQPPAPKYTE